MKKYCLAIAAFFCAVPAVAEPVDAQSLIKQLTQCDAGFFREIERQKTSLSVVAKLESKDGIAYFRVADRSAEGKNSLMFSTPLLIGAYPVVGYFDELVDLQDAGRYYSWGVLVKGDVQGVVAAFKPYIYEANRLRKDGELFVRSEIMNTNDAARGWVKNDTPVGGTIPSKGTVERVLLVEPAGGELQALVRVGCSLQGAVTPEVIKKERPDVHLSGQ